MILFYIATGDTSRPWQHAATVYVRAAARAAIKLPRGRYWMQTITAPTSMAYDAAIQQPIVEAGDLALLDPTRPALSLTVGASGSVTAARPSGRGREMLAGSQRNPFVVSGEPSAELPRSSADHSYDTLLEGELTG
ncbi:hypothetical protein [Sphingosinicella sp. BN140058]|uniref:hypothetical protein n=1 Tax=Sphingosinicella sp. BN140058 TaxID=1892855 RepID=UPI0010111FC1|nr:hypothetical protein [Sphingosinicella sp. BN140058]QAY80190.1 hypothetical protein ETR14_26470 [Sphingosinicella sp. BN140058]